MCKENEPVASTVKMKKRRRKDLLIVAVIAAVLFIYSNYKLSKHYAALQGVRENSEKRVTKLLQRHPEKRPLGQKKDLGVPKAEKIDCKIYSFEFKSKWVNDGHTRLCKVASPHAESCKIAHDLLFREPMPFCMDKESSEFCEIIKLRSARGWTVNCDSDEASRCESNLHLGLLKPLTDNIEWIEFLSTTSLEKHLMQVMYETAKVSNQHNVGFCFIQCGNESDTNTDLDDEAWDNEYPFFEVQIRTNKQLLILPPAPSRFEYETEKDKDSFDRINVNLILIDSVSRQHFYRSLKETAFFLEELNSGVSGSVASVLDFELIQAVSSRTFETLQTVFSGDINPSITPLGTPGSATKSLNLKPLLGGFKSMGYRTLWLEDLCHLWKWGISKDMHFLEKNSSLQDTWIRMRQNLAENMVDDMDMTLAQCRLLAANGVTNSFNSTDAVCFNGRHQHEYIFEYLSLYHNSLVARNKSFFSFTATNVGHERSGRRIQTLDDTLAQYVRTAARMENTLTVLFSDHGNSYGTFAESVPDNRLEVFHPFMFFIIPDSVSSKLGHNNMKSLGINTQRLVSALDLHYTLAHLSNPASAVSPRNKQYSVSRKGLFDTISASKTCEEIPLIMPNSCICEKLDSPANNTQDVSKWIIPQQDN